MTTTLITGIGELVTNTPGGRDLLGTIVDAAVVVDGSTLAWVGPAAEAPAADEQVDAGGRTVLPGFVDSHSHLVFGGDRSAEFAARMAGEPYAAGGIRTTVAATRAATDEQLTSHVARLVQEMRRQGTTTVEIKSGYGLTVHDEARSLAVARQFTEETTFLGAHVVPDGTDARGVRRAGHRPDARRLRAARPLGRRLLRTRSLRRRPGTSRPRRRGVRRAARPPARQPAGAGSRRTSWQRSSVWPPWTTAPT